MFCLDDKLSDPVSITGWNWTKTERKIRETILYLKKALHIFCYNHSDYLYQDEQGVLAGLYRKFNQQKLYIYPLKMFCQTQ